MKKAELCVSHAIPNAYFRKMFRMDGGNAIHLTDGPDKNKKTQDSGSDYLLCEQCEDAFNAEFDRPAISFLKKYRTQISSTGHRGIYPIRNLFQFVVSVIWRAAVSRASLYSQVQLSSADEFRIRSALFNRKQLRNVASVSIRNLSDSTPNGFSESELANFIQPPARFDGISKGKNYALYAMIFDGFVLTIHLPRLPYPRGRKRTFVTSEHRRVFAADFDIFSYPPMLQVMRSAFQKYKAGHQTFKG
ncbi:hypothetical protein [uncultured Maricaulis sp.]|uniref:hypothetical protein n=1 Tax=uncultured Maricaulis sp. TaxID=174710 RepID=UPI00260ABD91|nr:hypothetical protein [uncultured Maricaulis sp.]